MSDKQYFTLVFEGDIRAYKGNPLKTETPFGVPVAVGVGNAFDQIESLEDQIGASDDVDRLLWGPAPLASFSGRD
jgi:hypothetical protein